MIHRGPSNRIKAILCLAALLGPLVGAEFYLRAIGYTSERTAVRIIGGDRHGPMVDATVPDPDAFWVMRPDSVAGFVEYSAIINEFGCRDPIETPQSKDALRIVCIGDSTCFGNHTTWPRELERVLRDAIPDREIHTVNGGVLGYSSYQCLQLFKHHLIDLDPDLVVFCFGFNDSWPVARGHSDAELAAANHTFSAKMRRTFRTAQFLGDWADGDDRREPKNSEDPEDPRDRAPKENRPTRAIADPVPRVSPQQFTEVVQELIDLCRAGGAIPVAVTQPHAFPERGSALARKLPPAPTQRRDDHDDHNRILRELCQRQGVSCLDLAARARMHPARELVNDPFPGQDSIHQNPLGYRVWAEEIAAFLIDAGQIDASPISPPRYRVSASTLAHEAIDQDGDRADELILAGVFAQESGETTLRVLQVDPVSHQTREIPTSLPVPDAPVSIAKVYALGDALVITAPRGGDEGGVTLLITDQQGHMIRPPTYLSLGGQPDLHVRSVELDGDPRPEYAVSFGPDGVPHVVLLDDRLELFPRRPRLNPPSKVGVFVHAGRISTGDAPHPDVPAESLLVSNAIATWAAAMSYDTVRVFSPAGLRMRTQPLQLLAGQFHHDAEFEDLLALRHATLAHYDDRSECFEDPWFPFGAVRHERSIPNIGLALTRRGLVGEDELLAASRVGDRITVHTVFPDGTVPRFVLDLSP